jgi:hypothetical protein
MRIIIIPGVCQLYFLLYRLRAVTFLIFSLSLILRKVFHFVQQMYDESSPSRPGRQSDIRPSLIRINMEFKQQWYFFWFLYMLENDSKKQKFLKKGESASTRPPKILSAPLWVQISKFSE